MFDSIRRHNKIIQIVLFFLVFPAFVLVGVSSFNSVVSDEPVAKGSGVSVSSAEFDQMLKNALDQARGGDTKVEPASLDTPGLRQIVLDTLLARKLYTAESANAHMTVTPAQLQQALRSNPIVAPYLDAQGRLLADKKTEYENAVRLYGLDIASFEKKVELQVPLTQLDQVFSTGYFSHTTQPFLQRLTETREIQIQSFNTGSFVENLSVSDAQGENWYNKNKNSFAIPENVDVEYLIMDPLALGQSVSAPTEAQLQEFFAKNSNRFGGNVVREASHILIASSVNDGAEKQAAAKKKAAELRALILKDPGKFAELAKQNSDDPGSKNIGGSLGPITPGTMVKPFEDATFALKAAGEISPVTETEFGYHIIKLDQISGKQAAFADVRNDVLKAYQTDLGQKRFTEQSENFRNAVHEADNSLSEVAKNFKLPLQTATNIGRKVESNRGSGLDAAFAHKALIDALFAADSLKNKVNTEVLQVGDSRLIAARVTQHHAARIPPYPEVSDAAKAKLRLQLGAEAALAAAKKRLATLRAHPDDTSGFAATVNVSRMAAPTVPRAIVDAAMRAPADQLPSVELADMKGEGAALVRVLSVSAGKDSAQAQQMWTQQLQQAHNLSERIAFIQTMKARAGVKVLMPEKLQPSKSADHS